MQIAKQVIRKALPEIILFLVIAVLGLVYIRYVWIKFEKEQSENVLQIGNSVASTISATDLKELSANPGDIYKSQYLRLKEILKSIIRVNSKARFAYIYTEKNGKIYFMVDSEPEGSLDYSPPGQEYTEAKPEDLQPFIDGKAMVTSPLPDRWGTWVSVLIPIRDEATGKPIAVFGLDFNAKHWHDRLIFEVVESTIILSLLLLTFLFAVSIKFKNNALKKEITERKRAEKAVIEALSIAESGNRLKTAFMNNISHEIRTPLNGILGFTGLILQPDITEEEKKQYYSLIEASSKRLIQTVTSYMDISLIATGTMEVKKNLFDLHKVLQNLYDQYESLCQVKNIFLTLKMPDKVQKMMLLSDAELFQKVLSCLLDNAVKFTAKGSVSFGYVVKPGLIEFFVSDTGLGISKEAQTRIFEDFVQEESLLTRGHEGSGLGLSIAEGVASLLGGKIRLESEKGSGSVFFFDIPYEGTVTEQPSAEVEEKMDLWHSSPVVLIAEDDESNLFYLERILIKRGVNVFTAVNGREAVDQCHAHPEISLVLMDLKMPVMDGFEATRAIRLFRPELPVIAITAFSMSGDKKKALEAGCNEYLAKPVSKIELFEILSKHGIPINA
jgi:signal transduction histidine kinase